MNDPKTRLWSSFGLLLWLLPVFPAQAEQAHDDDQPPRYQLGFEIRAHYRDSDDVSFPSPVPLPPELLPPGQTRAFMKTVEPGTHGEVSVVTLWGKAQWTPLLAGKLKLDLIDRHDRNPTTTDRELDVDEAWLRFGRETEPGFLAPGWGSYLKVGKFPKFERQDDRHLESYGLISTAFNRLEDIGLEIGFDLGHHVYVKGSFTQGNPLFFRDPNALAGDNGTEKISVEGVLIEAGKLGSGFPIFYDADIDIDEVGFDNPETGLGIGARFGDTGGQKVADFLLWAYRRDLAAEVDIGNSAYGGDLDLLRGPFNAISLPITNGQKEEFGANLWLYLGSFTFFGQYVDQDLAGLDRTGYEAEVSWSFDLPLFASIAGRQFLPWIAPSIRFSKLDPDFALTPGYPAPSVVWDWEKIDLGLRLGLYESVDLTLEYQNNDFIRLGREESNDEFLATLRWAFDRGIGRARPLR